MKFISVIKGIAMGLIAVFIWYSLSLFCQDSSINLSTVELFFLKVLLIGLGGICTVRLYVGFFVKETKNFFLIVNSIFIGMVIVGCMILLFGITQEIFTQDVVINLTVIIFVILVICKVENLIFSRQVTDEEINNCMNYLRENKKRWNLSYDELKKIVLQKRERVKVIVIVIDIILLLVLSLLTKCTFGLSFSNCIVIGMCTALLIVYGLVKLIRYK